MHEAGIAASILDIAHTTAQERGARGVTAIKVRVGDFSGVVPDALQFAFECAREGTLAERATLIIERVALQTWCPFCSRAASPQPDLILWCETCGNPLEVRAGQELDVEYVDLDEAGGTAWNELLSSSES